MADPQTTEDFVEACSTVGELIGLLLVRRLSQEASREDAQTEKDELLTRKQAAKRLSVSVSTLDTWRRQGIVEAVPGFGERTARYRASDLERIISRRRK